MGQINQPARDENIAAIVAYCAGGIKSSCENIGVELEHTLVRADGASVGYSEEHGIAWVLEQLADSNREPTVDEAGNLLGYTSDAGNITLEPAAQIELSAGPFKSIKAIQTRFDEFEQELSSIANSQDIRVLTLGYHPTCKAADLELIPKMRYKLMNDYLGAISPFGVCMMRGSASTQVAIDYASVDDCLRKLRLASACVPLFALICDNSPIFEGAPSTHKLVRTEIWKFCDPARCGIIPGVMGEDFSLEKYAEYLLDVPAIFEIHGDERTPTEKTFGEIFAEKPMSTADIEHALSMLFNDVRLKTYIEIRPADAMPVEYVAAYAALVKGLFYFDASLDALDELFEGVTDKDISDAKDALMKSGYAAQVYGRPVAELTDELISAADGALNAEDKPYLEPLAKLVNARQTLADIAAFKFA